MTSRRWLQSTHNGMTVLELLLAVTMLLVFTGVVVMVSGGGGDNPYVDDIKGALRYNTEINALEAIMTGGGGGATKHWATFHSMIDSDDASDTSGTNTATADLDSHVTYYISKQFGSTPLYVKVGMAKADVITKENLATGTTYGDVTVDGIAMGAGIQLRSENSWLLRAEYLYTDYDDLSLTGSEDADSVTNKVDADVDTTAIKISLGLAF